MEKKATATVFNIQRFCVNDGPGIRTAVFLKGCMLNCIWCHNPESKFPKPIVSLTQKLCIGCMECIKTCSKHYFDEQKGHGIDRASCITCGRCVENCVGALEIMGKEMTVDEIIAEVMRDEDFYKTSGGGMTITGGDPLFRPEFTFELAKAAKEKGLHVCIETSGFAKWEQLERIAGFTDIFLFDIKESDPKLHEKFTGVSNGLILENLKKLDDMGAKTILRCPIIPSHNARDEHFISIADIANGLKNVIRIDIEPYHPLGKSKSEAIGEDYPLGDLGMPEEATVRGWIETIGKHTNVPVQKA
ncbi:MAG: glycyl-radical enzyme activating protein [Clostridia bacterium]|nr:glycyl-radical enzyme activating protein [Clostridia bacterium]